jgi:hypothetical protein
MPSRNARSAPSLSSEAERVPGLGVRRIEDRRARERWLGELGAAPSQEACPEHTERVRRSRRDLGRLAVAEQRFVVAARELPRVADQDPRQRRARAKQREPLERAARAGITFSRHLGPPEREPRARVVRALVGRALERPRRALEVAAVHRAPALVHRAPAPDERAKEGEKSARLTQPRAVTSIRAMDRSLLEKIIQSSPGTKKTDAGYIVADEHRASIYLGQGGSATVLADIVRLALKDAYIEAEARDRTLHYVPYEPVLVVSLRRPREDVPRTGF